MWTVWQSEPVKLNDTDVQIWDCLSGLVRFRSDGSNLCLTLDGGSGSSALASPCWASNVYLPLIVHAGMLF
jgi:hypothetical protein